MISWLRNILHRNATQGRAQSTAGEATPTPEIDNAKSTRSRADVRADVDQARAASQIPGSGEATSTPEIDSARPHRSREQVNAELDEYIKSGQRDRDKGETQIGG
jgi:hypothetical protein